MSTLHEAGISRTRKIAGYLLSLLASLGVFFSGVAKFFPNPSILDILQQLGVAEYAALIGVVEIGCVVLYWLPRTSNLGFFLFCSYVGGILVAELILGQIPLPAIGIGVMIYVGTLLRKPSLLRGEARPASA